MTTFRASVINSQGKKLTIEEPAISIELFKESLREKGYYLVSVKNGVKGHKGLLGLTLNVLDKNFLLGFTQNIYSLLEFGLDINASCSIMKDVYNKKREREFIARLNDKLSKGQKLSSVLQSIDPNLFDNFYITLVKAGELSGNLADSFKHLSLYLQKNKKIKDSIVSALLYPILLAISSFLSLNLLLFFILPNFKKIYQNWDFTAPLFIRVAFKISDFVTNSPLVYFIVILLVIILIVLLLKNKTSKNFLHSFLIKMPIIRALHKLQQRIKIAFSLEILLKSGITMERALYSMKNIEQNTILKEEYNRALDSLKQGNSLMESFNHIKSFDIRSKNILQISESTANIERGLNKVQSDASEALSLFIDRMVKMIEPAMMIFVALFVFFIMYLVISPTLGLLDKF